MKVSCSARNFLFFHLWVLLVSHGEIGAGASGAVPEALGDGPEDVSEMVRHVVPHTVPRPVAGLFRRAGVAPELLGDALFHDAAHLAAGGVVLDADGQVAEAFAVEEGEPLLREGRGLVLDVLFLGVEGDGVVFHVRFVLVFSDTDTALDRNYCRGIVFSPTYQSLRTSL